jgi:hypothetical protein
LKEIHVFCFVRFVKSLLILFYLGSSLPVLASYHYCLGRVKQISFYEEAYAACVCAEPEEAGECCDDEVRLLDFQDDHAKAQSAPLFSAGWLPLDWGLSRVVLDLRAVEQHFPLAHAPPLKRQAVYLLNEVFLI